MSKYNHEEENISKAVGLSVDKIMNKVESIYSDLSDDFKLSQHVENLELKLTHQELALALAIISREWVNSRDKNPLKGMPEMPEDMPDSLKEMLKRIEPFEDDCTCEKCVARRAKYGKEEGKAIDVVVKHLKVDKDGKISEAKDKEIIIDKDTPLGEGGEA
jgi:hypothetical protein